MKHNRVTFRVTIDMPHHLTKKSLQHWMEMVINSYRHNADPFVTVMQIDPKEEGNNNGKQ